MTNSNSSLAKSHSGWSNTKLTVLSIISIVIVTLFWVVVLLKDKIGNGNIFVILAAASIALLFICLLLFSRFKR